MQVRTGLVVFLILLCISILLRNRHNILPIVIKDVGAIHRLLD